ncbi:MAG: hypothetical protein V1798_10395 [Pseudomonadota bacterium]
MAAQMGSLAELGLFWAAMAFVVAPGLFWGGILFPRRDALERAVLGISFSLAAWIYGGFLLSYFSLRPVLPAGGAFALAGAFLWWRIRASRAIFARPDAISIALAIALLITALSRFGITFVHLLPPGKDPSFHLILVEKIVLAGRQITDWRPFEDVSLNYPIGTHVFMAELSRVTRLPPTAIFKWLSAFVGVLSVAQTYVFTLSLFRSRPVALWASVAFGWWAMLGSVDYYAWGGLPNLLALGLFVSAFTLMLPQANRPCPAWIPGFFLAAVCFAHHHVTLTAVLILGGLVFLAPKPVFRVLFWWLVLGGVYLVPYVLRAVTIGGTGALQDLDPVFDFARIFFLVGPLYLASLAGGGWLLRRTEPSEAVRWWLVTIVVLIVAFLFTDYGVRAVSLAFAGREIAPLVPSRFLTDWIMIAAPLAGLSIDGLLSRTRIRIFPMLSLAFILAFSTYPEWVRLNRMRTNEPYWEALRWIREHTPPDTLVFNRGSWCVYGSWRRCLESPMPSSEPLTLGTPKQRMFWEITHGRVPEEAGAVTWVGIWRTQDVRGRWPILWSHPEGASVVRFHGP